MRPALRIAILECDEPVGRTKIKYGSFGNLFQILLAAGASRYARDESKEAPRLIISKHDVYRKISYPQVDSVDAVLLTGSRYDSFTDGSSDWILRLVDFTRHLLEDQTRVKVMGVCFGHQVIARALGVMPTRSDIGWEVAVTPIDLTQRAKQLFGKDVLNIHEMHRDIVPYCPSLVELLASTARCNVQGMYSRGRLISMQGHPEFSEAIMSELLDLRRGVVLDDETYRDGKSRAGLSHDGVVVAAGFVRFLLES